MTVRCWNSALPCTAYCLYTHTRRSQHGSSTGKHTVSQFDQCGESGRPRFEHIQHATEHGRVFGVDHKSIQLQNPSTTLPIIDYVPTGAQYSGEVHLNVVERTPHVQVRHSGVAQALRPFQHVLTARTLNLKPALDSVRRRRLPRVCRNGGVHWSRL